MMSARAGRQGASPHPAVDELDRLRAAIEDVDRAIVERVAERLRLAEAVGSLKQEAGLPLFDPAREAAVVRRAASLAREMGVPDDDARTIFWHLVGMCRRAQAAGPTAAGER